MTFDYDEEIFANVDERTDFVEILHKDKEKESDAQF